MLEHYRRILAFRAAHPSLVKGSIEFLAASDDAIAFTRRQGGEQLLCAFNLGSEPAEILLEDNLSPVAIPGHGLSGHHANGRIVLEPYGGWFGRLA
jgi:alpha-glucosidase